MHQYRMQIENDESREMASLRQKKKTKLSKSKQLRLWSPPLGEPMLKGRTRWLDLGAVSKQQGLRRVFHDADHEPPVYVIQLTVFVIE